MQTAKKLKRPWLVKALGWLIVTLLATLIAAGVLWWRERQQAQAQAQDILRTAQVGQGDLELNVVASGAVAVNRRLDLRLSTPGVVASVAVKIGDRVDAGETLAQLDTAALGFAVRQSELALERARLSLQALTQPASDDDLTLAELAIQDAAQSLTVAGLSQDVSEAQRAYSVRLAQEARERVEEAYLDYQDTLEKYGLPAAYGAGMTVAYLEAEGAVGITQVKGDYQVAQAQSQWTAAYLAYRQAQESLSQLQAGADPDQVRLVELQIEQAQLNLAEVRATLTDTVLTAPFAGVVASVNLQVGAPAATGLPVITLLDDSAFFVETTVDEIDIGRIVAGQPVIVTLDAYQDAKLAGVVEEIAALPDAQLPAGLGGVIAYPLRVRLTDTAGAAVREGMTANLTVRTRTLENVVLVPNWAVRTDQSSGGTYAYGLVDAALTRRDITVGERNESYTVVLSGLTPGDTVALVTEERNLMEMRGPPSRGD